jgi:probable HAF family extracellular repeat protein
MMYTAAYGINSSGHIVGTCQEKTANGIKTHGFFYTNGLYATFDCPSTTYWTAATGINASGHIVGDYHGASHGSGFLYINGLYATIDYPSVAQTIGVGINDKGQIVGCYVESFSPIRLRGFLLSGGTYATIAYPSARDYTIPRGINNNGQIVGNYSDSSGGHGFLYNLNDGTYTTLDVP